MDWQRGSRYLSYWGGRGPQGLIGTAALQPPRTRQERIHRDAAWRAPEGTPAPVWTPLQLWLAARWQARGCEAALGHLSQSQQRRFERATGVPAAVQRRRAEHLARRYAIRPREALSLGLLRDGWSGRWAEFVYAQERHWNLAASAPGAARHVNLLGDKAATAELLAGLGVPVVDALVVPTQPRQAWTDAAVEQEVARWLDRWPSVHGKRRVGARGEGAFEIVPARSRRGWALRAYQQGTAAADPLAWLRTHLAGHSYLVQPRLTVHPTLAELADPSDIVTVRLVTRDAGAGPAVFSACLELPLAPSGDRQWYCLLRLDFDGTVVDKALPPWLRAEDAPDEDAAADGAPDDPAALLAQQARGRSVPGFASTVDHALAAHRALPGLFAVAWDIAITPGGNLFLEGNTGFGTLEPQWLAGGLLAGL